MLPAESGGDVPSRHRAKAERGDAPATPRWRAPRPAGHRLAPCLRYRPSTRPRQRRVPVQSEPDSIFPLPLVLERDLQFGAVGFHLAVLEMQVELDDLCNQEIAEVLSCTLDGRRRYLLPRSFARSAQLDDLVYAILHNSLLCVP